MHRAVSSPSARALQNERIDQTERLAAAVDDAALVAYQAKWRRKVVRLQRAFPARWRVPGLSDEEVCDRLTLRLIEAVRQPTPAELELQRPGKEWGFLVIRSELGALRQRFRLPTLPVDFAEISRACGSPTQEERWLELETEGQRALAQARAEQKLSQPQRRWLQALKLSARAGNFFDASDEPNLSAAARIVGKNRSSAQRSYRELKLRFGRERDRGS
jgi:hypothetical protein